MTADADFWKRQYQGMWDSSSDREKNISALIAFHTGAHLSSVGLGAGSSAFLSGSAASHGLQKGDADLRVDGTDIYIEVTGPLTKSVDETSALWFRPDKIQNAIVHFGDHDTWLLHHLPKSDLIRVIHVDQEFMESYQNHTFPIVHPTIRGQKETYAEIPSDSEFIQPPMALYRTIIKRLW